MRKKPFILCTHNIKIDTIFWSNKEQKDLYLVSQPNFVSGLGTKIFQIMSYWFLNVLKSFCTYRTYLHSLVLRISVQSLSCFFLCSVFLLRLFSFLKGSLKQHKQHHHVLSTGFNEKTGQRIFVRFSLHCVGSVHWTPLSCKCSCFLLHSWLPS